MYLGNKWKIIFYKNELIYFNLGYRNKPKEGV